MLISRPSNSGLKRLINIQKCRSSTKLDHCALAGSLSKVVAVDLFTKIDRLRVQARFL